jgi:hypothetical protein
MYEKSSAPSLKKSVPISEESTPHDAIVKTATTKRICFIEIYLRNKTTAFALFHEMNETNPVNSATKHNGVPTWRVSTVL